MRFSPLLAFTDGDRWRPGIGDPTFIGWLTVVAYALAAGLCIRDALREREVRPRFLFWSLLGIMLVLLGINKQLDLQTWLTLTGRHVARAHGWYERRRVFQFWFIIAIALSAFAGYAMVWRLAHEHGDDLWIPLLGLFLVVCFVVIRAASFHHIDEFLHTSIFGFRLNWLLELGGIGIIIAGALRAEQPIEETDSPALLDA